jgi:riboflavin kinase / FMN adenylyltransferase
MPRVADDLEARIADDLEPAGLVSLPLASRNRASTGAAEESFRSLLIRRAADVARRPRRVAIGNFDGVHLGHAETIRGCDTVLTFDPHPKALLGPDAAPEALTTLREKTELLGRLGIRELVILPFTPEVARQAPDDFVRDTLIGQLQAVRVSVGANFRYGARAAGDVDALGRYDAFETDVRELVRIDGDVVSSSRIRGALRRGDVVGAARMLGRPHRVPAVLVGAEGVEGGTAARVELRPGHACPPPGRYLCELWRGAGGGRRVRGLVDLLPPGEGTSAARHGVVLDAAEVPADLVALAFLVPDTMVGSSPAIPPPGETSSVHSLRSP